jgi:hypothetical protein
MAQRMRHIASTRHPAPPEAASDPGHRAELAVELLRRRLDSMAAIRDGLGSPRRRRRLRRKRLGDILTELEAFDATVPNQVSAEALRRCARAVSRRLADGRQDP